MLSRPIVYTDEFPFFNTLEKMEYQDRRIHHSKKIYVSRDIHNNTVDATARRWISRTGW